MKTIRSFLLALLLFPSISLATPCVLCANGTWVSVPPGGALGGPITPPQAACATVGSTPTATTYDGLATMTCGTPCSNSASSCRSVGAGRCDWDFFADDVESCVAMPGTLFRCQWAFSHSCCRAVPASDSCTQGGAAPATTATCGPAGGCGILDDYFGSVIPDGPGDDNALVVALITLFIGLLAGLVLHRFRMKTKQAPRER